MDKMQDDKESFVEEIGAQLDPDLLSWLESKAFKKDCKKRFIEADADGGGSLDPEEIIPLLRAMLPDSLKKHLTIG